MLRKQVLMILCLFLLTSPCFAGMIDISGLKAEYSFENSRLLITYTKVESEFILEVCDNHSTCGYLHIVPSCFDKWNGNQFIFIGSNKCRLRVFDNQMNLKFTSEWLSN